MRPCTQGDRAPVYVGRRPWCTRSELHLYLGTQPFVGSFDGIEWCEKVHVQDRQSAFNAVRRPRRCGLFRHGQAGAFAADQAGAAVLAGRKRRPAKGDCLMRRRSTVLCAFVALALAALVGMPARAQEKLSAEELAKLAPNPVGNLISVPFQNNTNLNSGRRRGRRTSSTSSRSFRSR